MTPEELSEVVAGLRRAGDDLADVEAKRASTDTLPKSCKDTLSAFANTNGGVLILGLDESQAFQAVGVGDPSKIMKDLASLCSNGMTPPLRARIDLHQFEGTDVVICEVDEIPASEKPCFANTLGMANGSFVRVHDGDQRLNQYEIQVLLANRGQPKDDAELVIEATIDDLDKTLVDKFSARLRMNRPYSFAELDDVELLLRSRVAGRDGEQVRPTIAGLLALGSFPQQYLPQLNLTFIHYPTPKGDDPTTGERFIDNVSIDGPIPVMVRDAIRVLHRNMSRRSTVTGAGREDVWEYPETALREAISNACVHRDLSPMSRGTQIQVEMYPDRLVVRNPGGLYGPVNVKSLGELGLSSSRNALLLRVLEDVPIPGETRTVCENRGSGIRSMINSLRAANMSLPEFRDRISSFEVTFPNHSLLSNDTVAWIKSLNHPDLTDTQCVALASLKQGRELNNESYRTLTGVDSRVATAELQDLVGRELVVKSGGRRWARYSIQESTKEGPESLLTRRPPADRRTAILDALGVDELSRNQIEERTGLQNQVVRYWLRILRQEGRVVIAGNSKLQSKNVRYKAVPTMIPGQQELPFE